ncbi:MAG TPA: tetratricopeptide repeat protein [Polyangiaceae bacterium]|nr:tetratricopeptide repeat protein [Polyangiaceae bacterium]
MRDSIEDLSALARRGELDEAEERRLRVGLQSSFEARLLHRAGLELDQDGSVLPGDDALAERIQRRVLDRTLPVAAPRRRRRLVAWGLAAAVACVAVGAAAGSLDVLRALSFSFGTAAKHAAPPPKKPTPAAPPAPAAVVQAPAAVVEPAPAAAVPAPPKPSAAVESGSPSELFASAASARRKGKAQEAIVLYDTLQSRYPGSAEANAADMALGMLRLQRGSARSALDHFRRYLAKNPRAELAPEALWGQAQALSSLGRTEEARRSFAALLDRYPDSTYASAARAKLDSAKKP